MGIAVKVAAYLLVMVALLFLPAGTLDWPEAWLFLTSHFTYSGGVILWLKRNNPALLKERASFRLPVKGWDRAVMLAATVLFLALFVVAGLDAVRYRWSRMPVALEVLGFAGFVPSLALFFIALKENPYASKIVEVRLDLGQRVVTTGPYACVRHPMYLGAIVYLLSLPLALGSYYALVPGLGLAVLIAIRTHLEDKTLHEELPGYGEYAERTRYRLVPGVW